MANPVWNATDKSNFFSKNDPNDPRLGDLVQSSAESPASIQADVVLWGYPDDEGIHLNGGRIGAELAPENIRRFFYKMTPPLRLQKKPQLVDFGNISKNIPLPDRHQHGSYVAQAFTKQNQAWISLGGGHDYGYADGSGFLRALVGQNRPVVINFDAHLDVRPTDKGYNSGTPFFRLLNEFHDQFDFFEVGIQSHCNSQKHLSWAESKGAHILHLADIEKRGLQNLLQEKLAPFMGRPLWFSLDMDALNSMEAPGCSQSWTTGLRTTEILKTMTWFKKYFSWKSFSIYEVSPPLDIDNQTSKLAALFMHHFVGLQTASDPEMQNLYGDL